ncbi:Maf family protein [Halobacillus yeomjeoni]|uniref:dTTP/UTP pyrophosphatase n=1 Tax=Halobacillus yeomjeoni TaxID=311194 RepID=A0A931HV25_9BACI|nr:Maf family protein [Halobacillus yeomjeoni]MBH0230020.1 septum formation protein Maf [Halobacillus yeomjeoni]
MCKLVLGSKSPRRKELLKNIGYDFIVRSSDVEETHPGNLSPEEVVSYLSEKKNRAISIESNEIVLTADTIVSKNGEILGKPQGEAEAHDYLQFLSGSTHEVFTGVTIRSESRFCSFSVCTHVTFFNLSNGEIHRYISTGEYMDKAGGYGIQGKGALLVERIEGDYYSVVGLPVSRVVR